jgi:hypothetical protein
MVQYYGAFYRSKLHRLMERINSYLMPFLRHKLKRLHGPRVRARARTSSARSRPHMSNYLVARQVAALTGP